LSTTEIATSASSKSAETTATDESELGRGRARGVRGRATEAIGWTVIRAWTAAAPLEHLDRLPDTSPGRAAGPRAER
jgi:hypothetical protein